MEASKYRDVTRNHEQRATRCWVLAIYEQDDDETRKLLVSACYLAGA